MGAAAALGGLAGLQPKAAAVVVGGTLVLAFAFRNPADSLSILIFLTAVVPYGVQNQLGFNSGPSLLLSDVLLVLGVAVALPRLVGLSLSRRELVLCVLVGTCVLVAVFDFVRGVRLGHGLSQPGFELRTLLGISTSLVALPILANERERRRFFGALIAVAVALGLWGVAQWFGHISFSAGDVGVRPGVRLTSSGKGQLQGGEFGFPIAVVVCYAVLLGGAAKGRLIRTGLVAAILLNAVSLLLTFERTFWIAAVVGILVVTAKATSTQRLRALLLMPPAVVVFFAALALFAPAELTTARERLLSVGQYGTDKSVRYRIVESQHVVSQIRQHPILGSGLGASIYWGQPWSQVPPRSQTFSHDSYLWLGWKIGVPAAILIVALFGMAIASRGPPKEDALRRSIRSGAQAALLSLAIISVTFSSFAELSATYVIGILLAVSLARVG